MGLRLGIEVPVASSRYLPLKPLALLLCGSKLLLQTLILLLQFGVGHLLNFELLLVLLVENAVPV